MNRDRARELLPIIQAFADGKGIQYTRMNDPWTNLNDPGFDSMGEYRIRPEPEVIYVNKCRNDIEVFKFKTEKEAQEYALGESFNKWDYVAKKFIEVLDDAN